MNGHKERQPCWGWLYAIFGCMVTLFYVEAKLSLSGTQKTIALLVILGAVYFLVNHWIGSELPFDPWS